MIKLIIFDFDGTLVDTKEMIERAIRASLGKYGYKITKEFLDLLGNWPIKETLEHIISNRKNIEKVAEDFILRKNKNFREAKLIKEIIALKSLKQRKIILSNNLSSFIKKVLKNLKIDFFDEIYGADKFHNKEEKFKKIIKKYKIKASQVIYIGDRPIDIKLAQKIGCISVAISHKASWSTRKKLLNEKPDYLISNLTHLIKIVGKYRYG